MTFFYKLTFNLIKNMSYLKFSFGSDVVCGGSSQQNSGRDIDLNLWAMKYKSHTYYN